MMRRIRAFTLLELIVAVGILAFVILGIASIFSAVGDTVSTGQRVSAVNTYAARVEAVMRRDLESLSRRGFLLIRHELTNDGTDEIDAALFPGDIRPRPRRIDQLMFFAEGEFESARRPMAPGINASGPAARIVYGHGMRAVEELTDTNTGGYLKPSVDVGVAELVAAPEVGGDLDSVRLGGPGSAGIENPNRYASDWTLMRHVTVLAPPLGRFARKLDEDIYDLDRETDLDRLRDREWQIALQPAALSVFRARLDDDVDANQDGIADPFPANSTIRIDAAVLPDTKTGLVDVASETLSEIERVVSNASTAPDVAPDTWFLETGGFDPATLSTREQMADWMRDALPGEGLEPNDDRYRVRTERTPPQLIVPEDQLDAAGDDAKRRERAYLEADQEMLASHGFIPRCTEFIVEWSFGWTFGDDTDADRFGRLQWYGLERRPVGAMMTEPTVAEYFEDGELAPMPGESVSRTDATFGETTWTADSLAELISPDLGLSTDEVVRDSVFGYIDPDPNRDGDTSDAAAWPWPTLLRFTIRFADPNDPEIESSIRFVVEVPGRGRLD